MMTELSQKKCVPCEGGTPPLDGNKVKEYLPKVESWMLKENSIEKTFKFKDFQSALEFVNKVGKIAEEEGHHPDINLHNYKLVTLTLSTHEAQGLTENDFIVAAKVNDLAN
jgi:4a-hydroxytetrahydrobiopterin dehydratase